MNEAPTIRNVRSESLIFGRTFIAVKSATACNKTDMQVFLTAQLAVKRG